MKKYLAAVALAAVLTQPAAAVTFPSLTTIYVGSGGDGQWRCREYGRCNFHPLLECQRHHRSNSGADLRRYRGCRECSQPEFGACTTRISGVRTPPSHSIH